MLAVIPVKLCIHCFVLYIKDILGEKQLSIVFTVSIFMELHVYYHKICIIKHSIYTLELVMP